MKVVHFCTYSIGGAAKAAVRLHEALLKKGIDSSIVFLYKNNLPVKQSYDFRDSISALQQIVLKIRNKLLNIKQQKAIRSIAELPEYFSYPQTVWNVEEHPLIKTADIIHFHWVSNFFDYKSFNSEKLKEKKIFWTLHDMHPFTGGFHYNNWFETKPWNALIKNNLEYITENCRNTKITLIAPSKWIQECSLSSQPFKDKKHIHLANPSSSSFFYIAKSEAQKQLNLNINEKYCFIPVDDPEYKRKGIRQLELLLAKEPIDITFITTGTRKLEIGTNKQINIGKISDESIMNLYFNASELMVFPSIAENYSNTLVEAMLCGCPVICFDTGGNNEIINTPESGLLIQNRDYEKMIKEIKSFAISEENRFLLAKTNSESQFSIEKITEQFISKYIE